MPTAYYYVPITITNNQSSATLNPFSQMITVDMSNYSTYANSNLSNVFFTDSSGNILNSWLESGNSNTSTSTIFWVNLPFSIGANSSVTINMCFDSTTANDFNTTTIGEAPHLTSTYAQYDNGSNVFPVYFNGNTTSNWSVSSEISLSQTTATFTNGNTINVIQYETNTDTTSAAEGIAYTGQSVGSGFWISEASFASDGSSTDLGVAGLGNTNNMIQVDTQWASSYFAESYVLNGSGTANQNTQGGTTTAFRYATLYFNSSSSFYGFIAPQFYSTSGGYSGTVSSNPISTITPLYFNATAINGAASGHWIIYNFGRVRAYPPNGVMPILSFGSVLQTLGLASATATFLTSQAIQSTGLGSATASFLVGQATSGKGSGSALASFILSQALNGKGLASTTVSLIASGITSTPEGLAKTSFFILAVSPLSGKTNASGDYNTVVSAAASLNNPTYPTSETLNYSATYLPPNTNVSSVSSSLNSSATITFTYSNTSSYTSPTLTTTIKDSTGTAIPNVLITWTSSNTSAATVSPQTATTNSSGVATTTVTGTGATITATTELLGLIQTSSVSV